MKIATKTLLVLYCILLLAQTACAVGWRIHGDCSLEQAQDHHDGDCQWDPCRLSYDSPVKSKLDDPSACLTIPALNAGGTEKDARTPAPLTAEAPSGSTSPRPAGNFPLLI